MANTRSWTYQLKVHGNSVFNNVGLAFLTGDKMNAQYMCKSQCNWWELMQSSCYQWQEMAKAVEHHVAFFTNMVFLYVLYVYSHSCWRTTKHFQAENSTHTWLGNPEKLITIYCTFNIFRELQIKFQGKCSFINKKVWLIHSKYKI